jgi:hypothetical protein
MLHSASESQPVWGGSPQVFVLVSQLSLSQSESCVHSTQVLSSVVAPCLQTGSASLVQSAFTRHSTQVWMLSSQTPLVQSASPRQPTQVSFVVSQTPLAQSPSLVHSTQVLFVLSVASTLQAGVGALQSPSSRHSTQTFVAVSQVPFAQSPSSTHSTQIVVVGSQTRLPAQSSSTVQGGSQVLLVRLQRFGAVQSPSSRHSTQALFVLGVATSQNGVGAAQSPSSRQATQTLSRGVAGAARAVGVDEALDAAVRSSCCTRRSCSRASSMHSTHTLLSTLPASVLHVGVDGKFNAQSSSRGRPRRCSWRGCRSARSGRARRSSRRCCTARTG